MNIAACMVNGNFQVLEMERDILSGLVDETQITDIRCIYCNARAQIVHDETRVWHFRAVHEPGCQLVDDNRNHRLIRLNDTTIIDDIDTILHHRDYAPSTIAPPPVTPGVVEPGPETTPEIDDIDCVYAYGTRIIHTVGGIYSYAKENGLDADIGSGITGRDLFLLSRELRNVRRRGMNGIRIAITRRFSPSILAHSIEIPPGYICLCDIFSTNIENAVFFLVKLEHDAQNNLFRDRIIGSRSDQSIKDRHNNILLLGDWREYPNDFYNVYISEINSRCYKFINYREFI